MSDSELLEPEFEDVQPAIDDDTNNVLASDEQKLVKKRGGKKNKKSQDAVVLSDSKKKRFIIFVGNLAYSTTKADLEEFFRNLDPQSIRIMTEKGTGKSKGFAFVEFADSQTLNAALEMHQTKFKGRPINIELTAGGGGSHSAQRNQKIMEKNEKLRSEKAQRK